MKNATIITLVLVIVGCLGISYDADGGLFNWKKCTPRGTQKPPMVPFPIDELDILRGTCDPEICPLPILPPTPGDPCAALAAKVARLEAIIETRCKPCGQQPIDIDAVIAKLPPVKMEIHHPDGNVYTQSKPLGESIRLRLVPQ